MPVTDHLATSIRSFLEAFQRDPKNRKTGGGGAGAGNASSQSSMCSRYGMSDPTSANAFCTDTVVILRNRKKEALRNSPFEGVALSNYKLRPQDVRCEVFDWVYHFLLIKNCPVPLATSIAKTIATKMEHEVSSSTSTTEGSDLRPSSTTTTTADLVTREQTADLSGRAAEEIEAGRNIGDGHDDDSRTPTTTTMDMIDSSLVSVSPPTAAAPLTSIELAKQSRELVAEYMDELSADPEKAVAIAGDYIDGAHSTTTTTVAAAAATNGNGTNGNHGHVAMPLSSSVFAIKNSRQTMEDRHIVIHDLNKTLEIDLPKQYSYYAIFDGHAGVDAASYSTAHLHYNLVASPAFHEGRIEEAFREAFEVTDQRYIKRYREDSLGSQKASGTTALVALIEDNKKVYIAWVGDSQAVLVRNGRPEEIMLPHRPDLESERTRISDLGGLVIYVDTWRVNGVLSVSRAIGDPEHKPYVNAEPSLVTFEIDPTLDFLVLGCDGLFDQLTGQDIASHVFEYMCRHETDEPPVVMEGVSAHLSAMAIQEGSSDNITTIVLFFKPFDQLVATGFPSETTAAFAAVNSELQSAAGIDVAVPKNEVEEQDDGPGIESAGDEFVPISTTNGGHFPYTDFGELPIGANYKITSDENGEGHNGGSPPQIDRALHVETNSAGGDGDKEFDAGDHFGDDEAIEVEQPKYEFNVDTDYNNQKERLFGEGLQKEQQQEEEQQQQQQHTLIDHNGDDHEDIEQSPAATKQQVEVEVHHSAAAVVADPFAPNSNDVIDKKLFDENFEPEREKSVEPATENDNETMEFEQQSHPTTDAAAAAADDDTDMATFVQPQEQQQQQQQLSTGDEHNPFAVPAELSETVGGKGVDDLKEFGDFEQSDIQPNAEKQQQHPFDIMGEETLGEHEESNQSIDNSNAGYCFDQSSFISMTAKEVVEPSPSASNPFGEDFGNPSVTEVESAPAPLEATPFGQQEVAAADEPTELAPAPVDAFAIVQQEITADEPAPAPLEATLFVQQDISADEQIPHDYDDPALMEFVSQDSYQPFPDTFDVADNIEHHILTHEVDIGAGAFVAETGDWPKCDQFEKADNAAFNSLPVTAGQNLFEAPTTASEDLFGGAGDAAAAPAQFESTKDIVGETRDEPKFDAFGGTTSDQAEQAENVVPANLETTTADLSMFEAPATASTDLFGGDGDAAAAQLESTQAIDVEDQFGHAANTTVVFQAEQEVSETRDQVAAAASVAPVEFEEEPVAPVVSVPEVSAEAEKVQEDLAAAQPEVGGNNEETQTAAAVVADVPADVVTSGEEKQTSAAVTAAAATVAATGIVAAAATAAVKKTTLKKPATSKVSAAAATSKSSTTTAAAAAKKAPTTSTSAALAKPKASATARVPLASRAPATKPLTAKAAPGTTTTASRAPTAPRVAATKPATTGAAKTTATTARVPISSRAPAAPTSRLTSRAPAAAKTVTSTAASTLTATRKPLTTAAAPRTATATSSRVPATSSTTATARARPTATTTSTTSASAARVAASRAAAAATSAATRKPASTSTLPKVGTRAPATGTTSTSRLVSRPAATAAGAAKAPTASTTRSPATKPLATRASPATKASPATAAAARAKPTTSTTRPSPRTTPGAAAAAGKTTTPTATKENGVKSITGRKSLIAGGMAAKTTTAAVPANGVEAATSETSGAATAAVASAPVADVVAPKTSPSFSKRNLMGVENSLKQELEDAVLNGLNNSAPAPVPVDNAGGDGTQPPPPSTVVGDNPLEGLVDPFTGGSDPSN